MKKIIAVLLVLVLALGFSGCKQHEQKPEEPTPPPQSEKTDAPAENANVPTEEGKVTYYLTLAEDSVPFEDFVSIYLTGGVFGWKIGAEALELANLEGTDIWYGISDAIPDPNSDDPQKFDYQLVLGYNAKSGLTDDAIGLQWIDSYKSEKSAAPGGTNNPTFEYAAGDKTVNLGEQKFTAVPAAPKKGDVTLSVTFTEALPEGAEVYIFGELNGWGYKEGFSKFESADGKTWMLALTDILCKDYAFKLKVFEAGKFNPENVWDGGVEFSDEGANMSFSFLEVDIGGVIDITNGQPLTYALSDTVNVTFSVEFEEALPEGSRVFIFGTVNGWNYKEGACEFTSEDGKIWTLAMNDLTIGVAEFKVKVFAPDTFNPENVWEGGVEYAGEDGNNAFIELTAEMNGTTVPLFPEPQTVAAA